MDEEKNIYVSGSQSGSPYIWKSTDKGISWISSASPGRFWYLVIDSSGVMWGGQFGGSIYKSTNMGTDWVYCYSAGQYLNDLTVSANNWIWGAAVNGLVFYSSDSGVTWEQDIITANHLYAIAGDPENNIYAGGLGKIYKTTNLGLTWQISYSGTVNTWINGIVADTGGQVYANRSGTILRSTDAGSTWFQLPGGSIGGGLSMDQDHNFYATPGSRSTDNCVTWQYIGPPWDETENYLKVDSSLFAAKDDGVYVENRDTIPYLGYDYFPLAIGNKWQFHQQSGYYKHLKNLVYYVDRDSVISGNRYFHLSGYVNDWIRYDHEAAMIFLRWGDSDYVFNNFSLNLGSGYNKILFNSHYIRWNTVLETENYSIFDSVYHTKVSGWIQASGTVAQGADTWYAEGLGEIKEEYSSTGPGGSYYSQTTKMIRAILNDSTGVKYYSDRRKPEIWFTPFAPSDTLVLNFNFEVDHIYTAYYWNGSLNERFIDTVLLYSYYGKGDSTIENEPVMLDTVPGSLYYTLQYFPDTLLINDGFDFYYKIYAVDKGIVSEFSTSPDTGWYKLNEPLPSGLNDKEKITAYALEQNYPNPFNPSTTIQFQIPKTSFVSLKVYDILGNEAATLLNEEKPAGTYEVKFNAANLAAGVYIYKLNAGGLTRAMKMILLK